jgi:hypothetical protein
VSQGQIGTIRLNIGMDLANEFSEIAPPDGHFWPLRLEVALKRAAYIARLLFATFMLPRVRCAASGVANRRAAYQ